MKTENDKSQPNIQDKPDDKRIKTVTPANDNGQAGAPKSLEIDELPSDNDNIEPELETSSNKGQGPAGEDL